LPLASAFCARIRPIAPPESRKRSPSIETPDCPTPCTVDGFDYRWFRRFFRIMEVML